MQQLAWGALVLACIGIKLFIWQKNPHDQSKAALLSEINGYLAWDSEIRLYPINDVEAFIKGVRARANNQKPPLKSTQDELFTLSQEAELEAYKTKINDNLASSEAFLAEIAKKPGIICAVDNLLYYEIIAEGSEPTVVNGPNSYNFHYSIKLPNDKTIFNTRENTHPQKVSLDDVIPGFAKGVMGMKTQERRILYIHPNLAFRTMHWTLPPNSALILDIEIHP